MSNKPRILVVDDESIVCEMAKRSLEHEGFEVAAFTDSTRALAVLERERFDVMITDVKMKEVDGLQLLGFVRKKWPETRVIVAMSSGTVSGRSSRILSPGASSVR